MVKRIIDAIIDNYERKLTASRENADRLSNALKDMNRKYERADDAKSDLLKQVTQLKRELATAQLDKLRAMDHMQAALACIPVEDVPSYDVETRATLSDAIFYAEPGTHIDALADAIAAAEEK